MGDSEDEISRQRREKFASERDDYARRGQNRPPPSPIDGSPPAKRYRRPEADVSQPPMMTFKQFLINQDDNITDMEAVAKYADYKTDFQKEQIAKFFSDHKSEDWFRTKYHPDECGRNKENEKKTVMNRLEAFMSLYNKDWLKNLSCDSKCSEALVRLLDAFVIKLEGGDDDSLKVLDAPDVDLGPDPVKPEPEPVAEPTSESNIEQKPPENAEEKVNGKADKEDVEMKDESKQAEVKKEATEVTEEKPKSPVKESKRSSGADSDVESLSSESGLDTGDDEPAPPGEGNESKKPARNVEPSKVEEKTRLYHRTKSVLLRNLHPSITRKEVEELSKSFGGFVRVALQDPAPERAWTRRAWITFAPSVNIKEICWSMNNSKIREHELTAVVNLDFKQRVRERDGLLLHKKLARNDLRLASKIVEALDHKWGLWSKAQPKEEEDGDISNGASSNPLLENIAEYLVEEANCEEEELLGVEEGEDTSNRFDKDESLNKVLDRLVLYLRMVHSIDYYFAKEYSGEDELPNRCGLIHVRGPYDKETISLNMVEEYLSTSEKEMSRFAKAHGDLTVKECIKLGRRDIEEEIERFINDNTQQLAEDKWLCPLSGKKFKGPDFIRKHILNKHQEKLAEVKKEVAFFNNYLRDSKRPMLPAHIRRSTDQNRDLNSYRGPPPPRQQYRPSGPGFRGAPPGPAPYNRPPPRNDPRQLVPYDDPELF